MNQLQVRLRLFLSLSFVVSSGLRTLNAITAATAATTATITMATTAIIVELKELGELPEVLEDEEGAGELVLEGTVEAPTEYGVTVGAVPVRTGFNALINSE